jgi:tripartite-type tricarboxylate transporter receptor subunit TctC
MTRLLALSAVIALLFPSLEVRAADDFYKGKTVKIIAGTGPSGGGYDLHARLIARHLGKHIPGNPNVVVQHMPAGSGMAATNHVFAVSEKDGTEIGLFNRNTLFSPVLGDNLAKYKSEEFNWLGTPASYSDNAWVFMIHSTQPYKTFDEMRQAKTPLNVGNIGNVLIRIMHETLGANIKVITGYTGNGIELAFERKEIDGHGSGYSNILGQYSHWLSSNFARIMVQFGRTTRLPALADVPTARELVRNPDELALLEISELPLTLGFPVAAPPGVPAERLALLRTAFEATMNDPEYRKDSAQAKMEFSPKFGPQLQADLQRMVKTPPAVTERYKKMVEEERAGQR